VEVVLQQRKGGGREHGKSPTNADYGKGPMAAAGGQAWRAVGAEECLEERLQQERHPHAHLCKLLIVVIFASRVYVKEITPLINFVLYIF
jgi:hypothetical protein